MNFKFLDMIFLLAYSSLIYWLSDQSSLPAPLLFSHQDKLIHAVAYGVMGWLSWRCFSNFLDRRFLLIATASFYCIIFALSDEWHQSFVPGRSADIYDWFADAIGSCLVIILLSKKVTIQE